LRGASAAPPASPIAPVPSASLLGIPEEEFTPSVREAASKLVHQIELLRREVEQTRTRLEDMARTADQDTLLPILNRRAFVREISRFIAFAERYGTPSSLLYFDLDNFKAVNDAYGHAAGTSYCDIFPILSPARFATATFLARLRGDEFGVLLTHVTFDQAKKKASPSQRACVTNHPCGMACGRVVSRAARMDCMRARARTWRWRKADSADVCGKAGRARTLGRNIGKKTVLDTGDQVPSAAACVFQPRQLQLIATHQIPETAAIAASRSLHASWRSSASYACKVCSSSSVMARANRFLSLVPSRGDL
jgi:diguanylate cyclase (GGDEF)-like protein